MLYTTRLQKITGIWCMVCFCFLCSCKQQPVNPKATEALPVNARLVTVQLQDSLGTVSFYVPNRLDTFFTWINYSDCFSCGFIEYRFQNKKLPVFKEDGFYYIMPSIFIDQLTILHSRYYPFKSKGDTMSILMLTKRRLEEVEKSFIRVNRTDTLIKVNNRFWGIVFAKGVHCDTKKYAASLSAITKIRGNTILFEYLRNHKDSFDTKPYFDSLWPLIKTFRLSEGM